MVALIGAAYAAPNKKAHNFILILLLGSPKTESNPSVNGKIQGLFKAFE